MTLYQPLLAAAVLGAAVVCGVLVHELSHALCLRAAGVPYRFRLGGGAPGGRLGALFGALASVQIRWIPPDVAPWHLRVASLSPIVLAAPLLAIGLGLLPDPFVTGHLYAQVALIGWIACAVPSPQDFSQCWHARAIVARAGRPAPPRDSPLGD